MVRPAGIEPVTFGFEVTSRGAVNARPHEHGRVKGQLKATAANCTQTYKLGAADLIPTSRTYRAALLMTTVKGGLGSAKAVHSHLRHTYRTIQCSVVTCRHLGYIFPCF